MKKILKVIGIIFGAIIIWFLISLYLQMKGNPIIRYNTKKLANIYLSDNYSNYDFEVNKVSYNFKDNTYYAHITSQSSIDSYFSVGFDKHGEVINDGFEAYVASKYNTYLRIDEKYRHLVDDVFKDTEFDNDSNFLYGILLAKENIIEYEGNFSNLQSLIMQDLELDKEYDIEELSKDYGHIKSIIEGDTSFENVAETMRTIKQIADENNLKFKYLSLGIRNADSDLHIMYFPIEYIESDDIIVKLEEAYANTNEFYSSVTK